MRCPWFLFQFCDNLLRPCVCPYNSIVQGLASLVVPDYGCFALVGYSDALDAAPGVALGFELLDGFFDAGLYGGYNLEGVMFVPAGSG